MVICVLELSAVAAVLPGFPGSPNYYFSGSLDLVVGLSVIGLALLIFRKFQDRSLKFSLNKSASSPTKDSQVGQSHSFLGVGFQFVQGILHRQKIVEIQLVNRTKGPQRVQTRRIL